MKNFNTIKNTLRLARITQIAFALQCVLIMSIDHPWTDLFVQITAGLLYLCMIGGIIAFLEILISEIKERNNL